MQGSLDNPPVVVVGSRLKRAMYLVLFAPVMAVISATEYYLDDDPYMALAMAAIAAVALIRIVLPQRKLVLGSLGFEVQGLMSTERYSWTAAANFRVDRRLPNSVDFDFRETPDKESKRASLGAGWEITAQELCDLLNRARARWGGPQ